MEPQEQYQIPVFNGDKFEFWCIKMKTLLMARDLWDVVESGALEESAKRQKDLRIKDMTALHVLQMSVTDSIFLRIGRATSSKQAWELLEAEFGETEYIQRRKRSDLEGKYHTMTMEDEESFDEYIEKFMEVVNGLKFYGRDVPDDELSVRIRRRLPSRFRETVLGLVSSNKNFTSSEVVYIMKEEEAEYRRFHEGEEDPRNHKTLGCYSNNKRGRR